MTFFLSLVLGDLLGRIGFFRATGAFLLLLVLSFVSYRLALANGGAAFAKTAAVGVPLATFAWAMWSPASSPMRLYIVEGVYLAARLLGWFTVFMMVLILLQVGFSISEWFDRGAWAYALMGGLLWTTQASLSAWTMRSDRLLGDGSVL